MVFEDVGAERVVEAYVSSARTSADWCMMYLLSEGKGSSITYATRRMGCSKRIKLVKYLKHVDVYFLSTCSVSQYGD